SKLSSRTACSRQVVCYVETRGDVGWNWPGPHLHRVGRIAFHPNARLLAFDRKRAMDAKLVADVEARTAELADPRRQLDSVAEARRPDEFRAGVDQRNTHDAVSRAEFVRLDAQRHFEQRPGTRVEILEKPRIEDNSRGVAMTPLDDE